MSKVYISYNTKDRGIANSISEGLKSLGHEILIDVDMLMAGDSMRSKLQAGIRNADGVIVIITDNSLKSQFVLTEIGTARTLSETDSSKFFIPILIGDIEVPPIVQDIFCLRISLAEIDIGLTKLDASILKFQANREEEVQQVERFETNVGQYVKEVISKLEKREKSNKLIGQSWYVLGYGALLGGVVSAVTDLIDISVLNENEIDLGVYILLGFKSIIVIGLLIALSKYAFNLGKSYVHESLKNADRIHAISFGEFYLKAFKKSINYDQVKEVFQHWNISNQSIFSNSNSNDFDPQLFEKLVKMASILGKHEKD